MTHSIRVIDAVTTGRQNDAIALAFEYMAATQAETGQSVPTNIDQLPTVLRRECENLDIVYARPGAFLVAYLDRQPIGCIGLAQHPASHVVEIKRLYVRPEHRGGVGRILMDHAQQHAVRSGFSRIVLDVLPSRTAVIDFYRRLGFVETEAPGPLISMERSNISDARP